ncbi:MAG TPA: hypothetical protein VF815_08510 [Myxococcaceae bacterium]
MASSLRFCSVICSTRWKPLMIVRPMNQSTSAPASLSRNGSASVNASVLS